MELKYLKNPDSDKLSNYPRDRYNFTSDCKSLIGLESLSLKDKEKEKRVLCCYVIPYIPILLCPAFVGSR